MDLRYLFAALWFLAIGAGALFALRERTAVVIVEQPASGGVVLHAYEFESSEVPPPSADEVFRRTVEPGWASRALSFFSGILGAGTGLLCVALVLPSVREEFPQADEWLRALIWLVAGLGMLPLALRPLPLAPRIAEAVRSRRRDLTEGAGELARGTVDISVEHGPGAGLIASLLGLIVRWAPTSFVAFSLSIAAASAGIAVVVVGLAWLPIW
jgi:hypothetical protein